MLLLPTAGDYSLAKRYIGDFSPGVRGFDALHLAVAANNAAEAIYSLDTGLLAAGRAWGLPMSAGIAE